MLPKTVITPWMQSVNDVLFKECVGMDHCLILQGRNLIVEVPRSETERVIGILKKVFPDVVDIRKAYPLLEDLHDFILVKPMISEAPLTIQESVPIPSLEKRLVDLYADKEYLFLSENEKRVLFQSAFEQYEVNRSRLLRYAARKGKKEEIHSSVEQLDQSRITLIRSIRETLVSEPVLRAWLFGSYSRMEERPDSDVDLLVDLDRTSHLGLLGFSQISERLENATGKKVDLVVNGTLKPFAQKSINHDKILIYERA